MSDTVETTFFAGTVLFDMMCLLPSLSPGDDTMTDSIAAVEAAWAKVALDIGRDPVHVIAATHGKRAIDNLAHFKPHIAAHPMDAAVQAFEESILSFADAYVKHGPGSREVSPVTSGEATPELASSRSSSVGSASGSENGRERSPSPVRPTFARRLTALLEYYASKDAMVKAGEMEDFDEPAVEWRTELEKTHAFEALQIEAAAVDCSVRILPRVKKLMDSIPEGRYAVATSGAKTYAYGCRMHVGIVPPPHPAVTITADDKRLKPTPDPFLLAARCVVFEDSQSSIRASVAAGATVIALCTSHERAQIADCGAHFVLHMMEQVPVRVLVEGEMLKFVVSERV